MTQVHTELRADDNQLQLLRNLGVDVPASAGIDDVIRQLELALGDRKFLEQARWFLLSVWRHHKGADWQSPEDSGLDAATQQSLAAALLEPVPVRNSLASVLSNRRARYRLLQFATQANRRDCVCSTGSKAYTAALALLNGTGHSGRSAAAGDEVTAGPLLTPITRRRAERRQAALHADQLSHAIAAAQPQPERPLSLADYEKLEQAILRPVDRRWHRRATVRTREDRLSLLLGVVTGVAGFLLVWWLLLD
ncbi:MAG: hypothetical protein RLZZ385_194 [Pseudomonadota bacterium]|jgi:hypothetical protein